MQLLNSAATSKHSTSQLVLVDVQQRLSEAMPLEAMQQVSQRCEILAQAAQLLEVPMIVTEQYPKGLGNTLTNIQTHLTDIKPIAKLEFSCVKNAEFNSRLHADRRQIVLVGMEAHICILQTALDLLAAGYQVFIAEDAVISRNPQNKVNAMHRLSQSGAIISNTESVIFEWLEVAQGDAFKILSKLIK